MWWALVPLSEPQVHGELGGHGHGAEELLRLLVVEAGDRCRAAARPRRRSRGAPRCRSRTRPAPRPWGRWRPRSGRSRGGRRARGRGLPEADAGVLDRVVGAGVEVALHAHVEVEAPVAREQVQHVVEEAHAGAARAGARAVQAQRRRARRSPWCAGRLDLGAVPLVGVRHAVIVVDARLHRLGVRRKPSARAMSRARAGQRRPGRRRHEHLASRAGGSDASTAPRRSGPRPRWAGRGWSPPRSRRRPSRCATPTNTQPAQRTRGARASAASPASCRCSGAKASAKASAASRSVGRNQHARGPAAASSRPAAASVSSGRRARPARPAPRDRGHEAVGAVLGLGQQVQGERAQHGRARCTPSATSSRSLGPGEAVDPDHRGELALGLLDVEVAGPGDHVHPGPRPRVPRPARPRPGRRPCGRPPPRRTARRRPGSAAGPGRPGRGGAQTTTSSTPAAWAVTTPITTVLGYGAAPARARRSAARRTATSRTATVWPWGSVDLAAGVVEAGQGDGARRWPPPAPARRAAPVSSSSSARLSSSASTRSGHGWAPAVSQRSVSSSTASSPSARTRSMTARTSSRRTWPPARAPARRPRPGPRRQRRSPRSILSRRIPVRRRARAPAGRRSTPP